MKSLINQEWTLDSGPSSAFHRLADPGHSFLTLGIELDPSNPSGSQVLPGDGSALGGLGRCVSPLPSSNPRIGKGKQLFADGDRALGQKITKPASS